MMLNKSYKVVGTNQESSFEFEPVSLLSNGKEAFLIGKSTEYGEEWRAYGIKKINNKFYLYSIKERKRTERYYTLIATSPIGTMFELSSDVSTGFWVDDEFTKRDEKALFTILKDVSELFLCIKTTAGFMIPNGKSKDGLVRYKKVK